MSQSFQMLMPDSEVMEALKNKGFYMGNKFGPFEKWEEGNKTITSVDFEFAQGKIIHYIFEQLTIGMKPIGNFLSKEEVIAKIKGL